MKIWLLIKNKINMKLNLGSSLETPSKTRFFIEDRCKLKYESKATWVKGSKYMPVTNRHSNSLPSKERGGYNVLLRKTVQWQ